VDVHNERSPPHTLAEEFYVCLVLGVNISNRFCEKFDPTTYVQFLCGDGQDVVLYKYRNE